MYVGHYFANLSLNPSVTGHEKAIEIERENGYLGQDVYGNRSYETVSISSQYNYDLHGLWFPKQGSEKTVIICHGYTYNLYGSLKYMDMFINRGYNVLVYDHRYHGKSGGHVCSMGYYEKDDLETCVSWVKNRVGQESIIGTHGESMGAATVLMHAAKDKRIDFVVADCPFESIYEQFKFRLKVEYNLPPVPILNFSNLFTKFKLNAKYKNISPLAVVDQIECPVFFIHGDSDAYIPYQHSQHLFDQKKGYKKLYFAKGADHAESFKTNASKYTQEVYEFLEEISM